MYRRMLSVIPKFCLSTQWQSRLFSSLPLDGIRVLDLSRVLAAPFATMNLSDLGAEVIKIEHPSTGDETRKWGPPFISENLSNYFSCCNRNKKSVAVDFTTTDGQEVIKRLARESDIVVENLKPGSLKKYGLDYKSLSGINDRLIYASLTGYGQDGPYSKCGAYDLTISAEGGLMGITGPENGLPVRVGVAITDVCSGLYLYSSVLAALYQRTITGAGQFIDVSMLLTQLSVLVNISSNYLNSGLIAQPRGSSHPSIVPYQGFETSDGYIVVAANNDTQFRDLAEAMGWPWLAGNPMFFTNELRVENREELVQHLSERFHEETSEYWIEQSRHFSFSVSPVNNIKQALEHPQATYSDIVKSVATPRDSVDVKFVGHPIRYNGQDPGRYTAPPYLGEHTQEVLEGLGYTACEIRELQCNNIIHILESNSKD